MTRLNRRVQASTVAFADRVQARSPRILRPAVRGLRSLNPGHLVTFVAHEFKNDLKFWGCFATATTLLTWVKIPGLLLIGVNPFVAVGIHVATGWPLAFAMIGARRAYLRATREPETAPPPLLEDYATFARRRRAEARAIASP